MDLKIKYPSLKAYIKPSIEMAKKDIAETVEFYSGNAQYGWERGRKLAKFQNRNPYTSFVIKAISTISMTKLRKNDIAPILGCIVFTFTNPIPGLGVLGFALGKALNSKLNRGLKYITSHITKIK